MGLEIYLDLFSQPCRSVYIFAKKNNIQFDYKKIALFDGMHCTTVLFIYIVTLWTLAYGACVSGVTLVQTALLVHHCV